MNLAARGAGRQREDFVMRLGCFLVSFAVLASLVLLPPKVKAFAMTSSAVTALAGGFLSACGLTPVVSGMGSSEEVNESVARLIQEYLTAELPGGVADAVEWLGQVSLTVNKTGKIIIPALVAQKLGLFARWVAGKYGAKPGVHVVYGVTGDYVTLVDGTKFYLCTNYDASARMFLNPGTPIPETGFPVVFTTGFSMNLRPDYDNGVGSVDYYNPEGERIFGHLASLGDESRWPMYVGVVDSTVFFLFPTLRLSAHFCSLSLSKFDIGAMTSVNESLSLDVAETITIPEGLTDSQSVALDVGATDSMSIQEILQGILDAILAGDLAASAEIVDEAVEPEKPDPPVVPVVPEGLDKLGAALTSRFPFSIPWDVYKGVTLLAAPPKAPYFEVDFMAPIADRVGGWKGSTKIVLDFSEYEIIGQVCRWTSTIGFCLMLASGTKRLIWTA